MKSGGTTSRLLPLSSSILEVLSDTNVSTFWEYSSNVLTSGGNDEIRGCTRSMGKKTDRASRQKRSLIIRRA